MAKPSTRQFHDDMGRRSTGWVEMESAPKGDGALGLKRPKLRLAGPLMSQRADDARQAMGRGAQTNVEYSRGAWLIQGDQARCCGCSDRGGQLVNRPLR